MMDSCVKYDLLTNLNCDAQWYTAEKMVKNGKK